MVKEKELFSGKLLKIYSKQIIRKIENYELMI